MRRLSPAELILGAAVAGALIGDAWIVRARLDRPELELVTDVLRRPAVFGALLYLVAHVVDVLGPFDLFRLVCRALSRPTER